MKYLWGKIQELNISIRCKSRLYIFILMLLMAIVGAVVWAVIGRRFLPGMDWLICFVGYPSVILGYLGGLIYLCNHEFRP